MTIPIQNKTLANIVTYNSTVSNITVTKIEPIYGSYLGGTNITITGTGFISPANVIIDGNECNSVTVVNSTSIKCTTATANMYAKKSFVVTSNGYPVRIACKPFKYVWRWS